MNKKAYIEFPEKKYQVLIDSDNSVATKFIEYMPIISEANNIGGEIYFRTNGADIEYNGTQSEEFEIGDVVYWRSPVGESKYAIALFYGNTRYSDWKTPRASSPCVKIGKISDNIDDVQLIKTGETVNFYLI